PHARRGADRPAPGLGGRRARQPGPGARPAGGPARRAARAAGDPRRCGMHRGGAGRRGGQEDGLSSYHMTPDEFRRWGREAVEWVARYMERIEEFPVLSRVAPGDVRQASASSAALCALVAARERATGGAVNRHGLDRRLPVYISSQTHSAVEKAVRIAGLGSEAIRVIDVDERHAMRVDDLERRL